MLRRSDVVWSMSRSRVTTRPFTTPTKRSNSGREMVRLPPPATSSNAGSRRAHAASKSANAEEIAGVLGTNKGRAGSPVRNVATTRSNTSISFAISARVSAAASPCRIS